VDIRSTSEIELDGLAPEEAFSILGNEMRLDIVRALWSAGALREYEEVDDADATISFSELRQAVDIRDNGQFNYHLSKLVPHFVRRTDGGYRLSEPGKRIARTVVATSGGQPDLSAGVRTTCPLCGSSVTAAYDEQWLRFSCTECDGMFGDVAPDGAIFYAGFPAAGLNGRSPDHALEAGLYRCMLDLAYLMRGVCRECAGPIASSVSVCESHDASGDGSCLTCGTPFVAWVTLRCEGCRFTKRLPIELCVMGLTPVIGALYDRGIDVLSPSFGDLVGAIATLFRTTVTHDPLQVTVAIEDELDRLTLTFDDEMTLVDTDR